MLFTVDLDQTHLRQFDEVTQAELKALAEETDRRRKEQIEQSRKIGPHVKVIEMTDTAHYCFVHRPRVS